MILNTKLAFEGFCLGFLFSSSFISLFELFFGFDFALAFLGHSSSRISFLSSSSSISKSSSLSAASDSASSVSFVARPVPRPLLPRPLLLQPRQPLLPRPLLLPCPLPRPAFGFGCSLAAAAFPTLFWTWHHAQKPKQLFILQVPKRQHNFANASITDSGLSLAIFSASSSAASSRDLLICFARLRRKPSCSSRVKG